MSMNESFLAKCDFWHVPDINFSPFCSSMALIVHGATRRQAWAMAGDLGKPGQRDSIRVNILEAQELQALCAEFGCTAEQLKTAVSRAGVMATDVRAFLQDQDWRATPRRPRVLAGMLSLRQLYR